MKKIIFYIIKESQDDSNLIFNSENKNSLFEIIDEKYFFNSKYKIEAEEILVNYSNINFDEHLMIIFKNQIEIAREISEEKIEKHHLTEDNFKAIICSKDNMGNINLYFIL